MATTNSPNGLTSFGVPVLPGLPLPFTGNYWFVDPDTGSDGFEGNSANRPFATLYRAYSKCVSGNNDVIILIGNGTDTGSAVLSTALAQTINSAATSGKLTLNKNATHIIGISGLNNHSRARIAPPSGTYTQATFNSLVMVEVTGTGCFFANLCAYNGFSTGAAGQICWQDSGGHNSYFNCQFQGMEDAASAAAAASRSLVVTGTVGENTFNNCIIGDDVVSRGAANANLELAGATPRNTFRNCIFPTQGSVAGVLNILGTGAGCINRWHLFDNCMFINNTKSGSTAATAAASFTNAAPGGLLMFKSCSLIGFTKWGDANALANSFIDMPAVSAAAGGLSLAPS